MTPSLKSKLVKRLRELADGAEPSAEYGEVCTGICHEISQSLDGGEYNAEDHKSARHVVDLAVRDFGIDKFQFAFPCNDWGNDRRTLAGILAAYIETEC